MAQLWEGATRKRPSAWLVIKRASRFEISNLVKAKRSEVKENRGGQKFLRGHSRKRLLFYLCPPSHPRAPATPSPSAANILLLSALTSSPGAASRAVGRGKERSAAGALASRGRVRALHPLPIGFASVARVFPSAWTSGSWCRSKIRQGRLWKKNRWSKNRSGSTFLPWWRALFVISAPLQTIEERNFACKIRLHIGGETGPIKYKMYFCTRKMLSSQW